MYERGGNSSIWESGASKLSKKRQAKKPNWFPRSFLSFFLSLLALLLCLPREKYSWRPRLSSSQRLDPAIVFIPGNQLFEVRKDGPLGKVKAK